ncbi:MAG: hypothetical protein IKN27_01720 [Selenomonadaceae bacterium]|nr:hypothetical protein [Selenomonadaceae bacterium]
MIKICARCGKKFDALFAREKACSLECKAEIAKVNRQFRDKPKQKAVRNVARYTTANIPADVITKTNNRRRQKLWSDEELKLFEHEATPEETKLFNDKWAVTCLRRQIQDLRTAARLITSTVWTPEALEYVRNVAETAAPALKSLEDKLDSLSLEFKTLEAST